MTTSAQLQSLINNVYILTKSPHLVEKTLWAVRRATLKAHQSDYYPKDIYETGIQFDTPAFVQSLDYRTLVPRYRSLKYLRPCTSAGIPTDKPFDIITPEQIFDGFSTERVGVCYLAGESLEIKAAVQLEYMLFGCYVHPDITLENFNSWIALEYPSLIELQAATHIFKSIGYDEQASMLKADLKEEYEALKQQAVAVGY